MKIITVEFTPSETSKTDGKWCYQKVTVEIYEEHEASLVANKKDSIKEEWRGWK